MYPLKEEGGINDEMNDKLGDGRRQYGDRHSA